MVDEPIRVPDLSSRAHNLEVEHLIAAPPSVVYVAWSEQFDRWFADPGSVIMRAAVNEPFFFETVYQGIRSPHYGRFLRLEPDKLVELTWVTGAGGTEGAETVVTVELTGVADADSATASTLLHLSHAGFADEAARERHIQAWPLVLDQLDQRIRLSGAGRAGA